MKKLKPKPKTLDGLRKISETSRKSWEKRYGPKSQQKAKVKVYGVWTELDVTNEYIEQYRLLNPYCEICGKIDGIMNRKLAVDHCHDLVMFRGLLCTKCNMNYDWYIKNKTGIELYFNK